MTQYPSEDFPGFVIAGCFNRDTILPISGPPQIDVLGGNLAYAAVGLHLWGGTAGLLARVGQDFPEHWLARFKDRAFDLSGVNIVSEEMDIRRFMAHEDAKVTHHHNPVQHFADRKLAYPPSLIGFRGDKPSLNNRSDPEKQSIRFSDVPKAYLDASAVHICPVDYLTHMILPPIFRQGQASTITLASAPGYMDPSFWEEMPGLLSDITAFITLEEDLRNLFQGRRTNLWEMAEVLAGYGPEYVLIQTLDQGYFLMDAEQGKRWVVPNYPSKVVDPTGAKDAFAGAFLKGYREHYDPLEATIMGSITAALVSEGSGVFYALDVMPGLIEARKEALRELVHEVMI